MDAVVDAVPICVRVQLPFSLGVVVVLGQLLLRVLMPDIARLDLGQLAELAVPWRGTGLRQQVLLFPRDSILGVRLLNHVDLPLGVLRQVRVVLHSDGSDLVRNPAFILGSLASLVLIPVPVEKDDLLLEPRVVLVAAADLQLSPLQHFLQDANFVVLLPDVLLISARGIFFVLFESTFKNSDLIV